MPVATISFSADLKKAKGEPILAVIYARYSSHSQTEQSIEGQLAAAHGYAKGKGYTVIHEYCDRAVSGRTDNRDAFQQMLSDTDKHQFDVIITWKVDRIGRNREDIAFNKHRCKKNGIKIEYVAENLPDSAESVILESVLEGMAEYYSLQLSTNIRRGQLESARKLQCVGGTRPLGYDVDKETKRYIIDEKTSPIVKQIFERYARGQTEFEIIQWLNEQGIRTTKKKPFSKSSLAKLLHNEKYIGVYTYGDAVRVEDGMPAIIDKGTFDKVQSLMKVNRRAPSHTWTRQEYILTDKLFCGSCGSPMVGESGFSKTGAKYSYYSCVGKRKKGICSKHPIRQDWIEDKVLKATQELLDDEVIDFLAEQTYAYYLKINGNEEQQRILNNELATVNTSIDRLVSAIEAGAFNDRIKARLDDLNTQKAQITASIAELELAFGFRLSQDHIAFFLRQFRDANLECRELQKKLVQIFVNAVFVYDDKIKIVYNYTEGNNTVTLETVEKASSEDTEEGFVHCALCSTIAIRYEPGIIIFGSTFMVSIEKTDG